MAKSIMKNLIYILVVLTLTISHVTYAESIPSSEWTQSEQKWVNEARVLYQNQGLEFSEAQAGEAVYKMRNKTVKGVPPSEWTQQEQKMVNEMRVLYKKKNISLTQEQEQIQVQTMREKIAKMNGTFSVINGLSNGSIKASSTSIPTTISVNSGEVVSEESLANRIANLPKSTGNIDVIGRRDGFDVNGKTILDPEGRIISYAYDVITGDITYLIRTSDSFAIKFMRANSSADPILLARAKRNAHGDWEVVTVTGKNISGFSLSMSTVGFLVGRDTAAFRYTPGNGVSNIAIPEGFLLTPIQHGDVGATGYVMLEKADSSSDATNGKGLVNSLKSLGSSFGLNKKEDYALMHVESGKLYPLNIDSDGKKVMKMSHCRKKNQFINECSTAMTFESVYSPDGTPNMSHYYWLAHWYKTPSGPVAITMENGVKDIFITDLTTGKKVVGFSRLLGIQSFNTKQFADGRVALTANWAFSQHEIPDLEKHLQTGKSVADMDSAVNHYPNKNE